MKRSATLTQMLLIMLIASLFLNAQDFVSSYQRNAFLMGTPASYQNGLLGFANPANAAFLERLNGRFYWSTDGDDALSFRNWGLFTGVKGIGFGMQNQKANGLSVRDYQLSLAGGGTSGAIGIALIWASGREKLFNRENLLSVGWIERPSRYLSVGVTGNFSLETSAREGLFEIGLRPLGDPRFTLFADLAMQKKNQLDNAPWSAGGAIDVLPGLTVTGRYFDNEAFTIGISLSSGFGRTSAQSHFDSDNNLSYNSFSTGFGNYQPDFYENIFSGPPRYLPMNMKGTVSYLNYRLLDSGKLRFMDILQDIRKARENPTVDAIALNLSGLKVRPEHAWEIREELLAARRAGKTIVAFIDNGSITTYHIASVADRIMIDPEGSLMLPGYLLGRTYLKGTLEKLGLGFDEWRFFKYKSAVEGYSRDSMSEGDREQRQALVDGWYDLLRSDVAATRDLTAGKLDTLINEDMYFIAGHALESGLVDTLGRWNGINDMMNQLIGKSLPVKQAELDARDAMQLDWGRNPRIAVVYALGVCAMDEGIRARWLEKKLLQLEKRRDIKAVVLRVDSPGGDGMASDYVAEAVKKLKQKKPVIISQGQLAASGGYWISMNGSKIFAGPGTITGSIGVIGGWVYDKGLSEKLGMTSDHVQRGNFADIGYGVTLPLLGIRVPSRNLTEVERARMEQIIRGMYDRFIRKVAEGRSMEVQAVSDIAQGRVWTGVDGKKFGLVDELGGLSEAISAAKSLAGIAPDRKVDILEFPRDRGLFNADAFNPLPIRLDDPVLDFLKLMTARPGYPLPLLMPEFYPVSSE